MLISVVPNQLLSIPTVLIEQSRRQAHAVDW
ncbi:hypothetical protein CGMCC3_g622 [Colletotrichum fructicola]|nr:uncharacterized protein CGMCC3_g622 [Colletotrichum fructicola]KAE9583548.1 hypothetical protein CGMCC3_g622 [Colletotrichum fructicola]